MSKEPKSYYLQRSGAPCRPVECLISCVGFAPSRPASHGRLIRRLIGVLVEQFGSSRAQIIWDDHVQVPEGEEQWGAGGSSGAGERYESIRSTSKWLVGPNARWWDALSMLSERAPRTRTRKKYSFVDWALHYHDRRYAGDFRSDARISVHVSGQHFLALGYAGGRALVERIIDAFADTPEIHQGFVEAAHRLETCDGDLWCSNPPLGVSYRREFEGWEWQRSGAVTRDFVRCEHWGTYIGAKIAARADSARDLLERYNDRVWATGRNAHGGKRYPSGALYLYTSATPFDEVLLDVFAGAEVAENVTWIRDELRRTDTLWHLGRAMKDPLLSRNAGKLLPSDYPWARPKREPPESKPKRRKRARSKAKASESKTSKAKHGVSASAARDRSERGVRQ